MLWCICGWLLKVGFNSLAVILFCLFFQFCAYLFGSDVFVLCCIEYFAFELPLGTVSTASWVVLLTYGTCVMGCLAVYFRVSRIGAFGTDPIRMETLMPTNEEL